jgi:hypothetical protein
MINIEEKIPVLNVLKYFKRLHSICHRVDLHLQKEIKREVSAALQHTKCQFSLAIVNRNLATNCNVTNL